MTAAVGVDIGGTKLLSVLVVDGELAASTKITKPGPGRSMIAAIAEEAQRLAEAEGHRIATCGVGIAGLVDHDAGQFVWGPHVDGVELDLRSGLEDRLGIPVAVDNDANTTAYAEYRLGAGTGSRAMLMLTLGTGIGAAMVFDGRLYRGRGFAGEFGHARFGAGRELCECGLRGCWETEAAGPALERVARQLVASDPAGSLAGALEGGAPTGPAVSRAAAAGDPQAIALLTRVGRAFGEGLASVITMLDPDRIVVGGGLGSVGELLLGPARAAAAEARYASAHSATPPIVAAALGESAGAVGAAMMATDELGVR